MLNSAQFYFITILPITYENGRDIDGIWGVLLFWQKWLVNKVMSQSKYFILRCDREKIELCFLLKKFIILASTSTFCEQIIFLYKVDIFVICELKQMIVVDSVLTMHWSLLFVVLNIQQIRLFSIPQNENIYKAHSWEGGKMSKNESRRKKYRKILIAKIFAFERK